MSINIQLVGGKTSIIDDIDSYVLDRVWYCWQGHGRFAVCDIKMGGECWRDILDEMTIIQNAARASRIEAKPEWTNITKDERSCQDGPKKPSCPVCGKQVNEFDYNEHKWVAMDRKEYCSVKCSIAGRNMTERHAKCQGKPLAGIFAYYGLGPEEGAELLERVRSTTHD